MTAKAFYILILIGLANPSFAGSPVECSSIASIQRGPEFSSIPEKYQIPKEFINERGKVVVFRGVRKEDSNKDETSYAYKNSYFEFFHHVKKVVEEGDMKQIFRTIDDTTYGAIVAKMPRKFEPEQNIFSKRGSPLISTTFSPALAQRYARGNPGSGRKQLPREEYTIQMIELDPKRVLYDVDNVGGTGKAGEIFVLGEILKEEIVAIKKDNRLERAEAYYGKDGKFESDGMFAYEMDYIELTSHATHKIREASNWHFLKPMEDYSRYIETKKEP